jgi:tryptophan-rich sensory protein
MKFKKWKPYIFFILLSEGVGALSWLFTRNAMMLYSAGIEQPPLSPPAWLFPVVWIILYALMGISAARVATSPNKTDNTGLNLFIAQLIVNFFWSFLFFNAQAFGFAAIWLILLWVLVLLMILSFRKVDMKAAWLQIPYLIWLTFAAYLNLGVYLLN